MKLPYKLNEVPILMGRLGIEYFAYGTLLLEKRQMFSYFKTDRISSEQIEGLKRICKDVVVKTIGPSYAPEIKRVAILFPKSAWYRENQSIKLCSV